MFGLLLLLIIVHLLWISHREAAIFAVERTKQMTKNEEQLMRTRAIHDKLRDTRMSMVSGLNMSVGTRPHRLRAAAELAQRSRLFLDIDVAVSIARL